MWKSSLNLDKYLYARTNPYLVKGLGLAGLIATLLMGYGFWIFIQLNPIYIFIFGPIVFIFIFNKILRYILQFFYQKFDIKKHEEFITKFWSENDEPSVSVFLPWAGEDLKMHEEVVRGVALLNYRNLKVYMLDDVGSSEHRALAEKYNFIYLSRPNKGEFKKSGNLQYGYSHSDSEFVLILDADFIPIKDALKDLIPYIATDREIGILQTPQYFEQTKNIHSKSRIEFGGGNIVEEFYRVVMPCRDEFKAAMCVGTSAIYRRSAIASLQGTPKVHASEDLATGLMITRFGYYVKYLPLIVSMGKSPDTFQGYFKQHMRWCSGNLVWARYWPGARLNLMARLIYITNPLHYLSEALTVIFSFQLLVLLYFHADSLSIVHTLYFIPYVVLSRVVLPLTKANKNKIGTRLAALNNSYTYFYTYIRMLVKGVPAWHPSGVKSSGLHSDFINAFNIGIVISSVYIICFWIILLTKFHIFGNFNTYIVLAWSFYSVFWHVFFLTSISEYVHPFRIAAVRNFREKAFVYLKTNLMLVLLILLISLTIPAIVVSLMNPKSPTVIAVNQLVDDKDEPKIIASAVTQIEDKKTVLGVQAKKEPVKGYTFIVESGDSLVDLAEEAIENYSEQKDIEISHSELTYAAHYLATNIEEDPLIKPDEKITFDIKLIKDSVDTAKEEL